MTLHPIQLNAKIERKDPSLPRFVVVPAELLKTWALSATTVVNVTVDEVAIGRRALKRWDDERWFFELPQAVCTSCAVDTGANARFQLRLAADELPSELTRLLRTSPAAKAAWNALTPSQQRMLRESVLAAKAPTTRRRRALRGLGLPESS